MAKRAKSGDHRWRFFRAGGVDQVRLDTGADIENLVHLDKKLWVALSCPVKGLEFDERTLALMDTDGDGRVRSPEILAAIDWLAGVTKSLDGAVQEKDGFPLAMIDTGTDAGQALLDAASVIVSRLELDGAKEITVADAERSTEVFNKSAKNGDGIVPPDTVVSESARSVAEDIVKCLGGKEDRSGALGIDQELLDRFFAECEAYEAWHRPAEGDKKVMPLGADTGAAVAAFNAVRAKIDDYFARCHLAAYDPRAKEVLTGLDVAYESAKGTELSATASEFANLPLQQIEADRPLDLTKGINPAWAGPMANFATRVVKPLAPKETGTLSEAAWNTIKASFDDYAAWQGKKAGAAVETLGIDRVREILSSKARKVLVADIADDVDFADEAKNIINVERAARYWRDLHKLLVNFVSFEDFYTRERPATFQAGTLYLDGRSCDLCVRVDDLGKHGALAALAKSYLAYCECTRPSGEKMTIAAAFTAGDSDHLMVGRNGVFFDRKGRDWDATITKLVDNPISIPQAFFAPYKRVLRFIEESVAKRAAAADSAATGKLEGAALSAGKSATTGTAGPKPKMDIGVVAAIGVAVGGITAALGALLQSFFGLGIWMPLGILALVLLISGPSMLIAWLKLRQRNLGPILDANGWAVNGRAKVNIPLGASLTAKAEIPSGSERSFVDPFAAKKSRWPKVLFWLIVLGLIVYGLYRAEVKPVKNFIDEQVIYRIWPDKKPVEGIPITPTEDGEPPVEDGK
ncbi:MAG: hypothetical protein KDB53_12900 [Planctomycetes bacterium]|nr:hypothetical protein [Planctomycetota bacterium]